MKKTVIILVLLFGIQQIRAQHFTHDVGFMFGTATIQTDYGQRGNFLSSYGNSNLSFSFNHYLHFFNKDLRWNADHKFWSYVSLKTEVNFVLKRDLEHSGEFVDGNTDLAKLLRAMKGSTQIFNVGFELNYHINCLRDFVYPYSKTKWSPYFAFGIKYSAFENTLESSLGDWRQDITVLPQKWRVPGALDVGKGSALSATLGFGTRYKLSQKLDAVSQFNWQVFFSDALDGLQADVIENKKNEWLINLQVGLIYHLNFSRPLGTEILNF
ncbi:hypothetical protein OD91_1235 [Lutibacter sp. Hel_I_33_5]|uniref:THC0290_0291 family protein n=1 Tax=Lutibacter sp. Hel_I_33_5 TaxID=1566289 RepID=UPI0011A5AA01|nr:hypothetical protein [Lutibacter sp. Hel_I_33_5]TVZ55961.1 hypothetical protein OD91_1235 [Lutibacter sp. Hel_I_33_5]